MIKLCYKCDTKKNISLFSKNRTRKDGLADQCKGCDSERKRAWRKDNPQLHLEIQRVWRSKNRDKVRATKIATGRTTPMKFSPLRVSGLSHERGAHLLVNHSQQDKRQSGVNRSGYEVHR